VELDDELGANMDAILSSLNTVLSIPNDVKNNAMFVTCIAMDHQRRCISYYDDCGAWNSAKVTTINTQNLYKYGRLVYVAKCGSLYCMGGRNGKWIPLSLQPDASQIVTVHWNCVAEG